MYFTACDIENVPYGVISGRCSKGDIFETPYKWLSQFCRFFPPIFISHDQEKLAGYSQVGDKILFGFKSLRGFSVSYECWMIVVGILLNLDTDDFTLMDKRLSDGLKNLESEGQLDLSRFNTMDSYLKSELFAKKDQFVIDKLDLRKSNAIICRNETQRVNLTRKGFMFSQIKIASTYSRLY